MVEGDGCWRWDYEWQSTVGPRNGATNEADVGNGAGLSNGAINDRVWQVLATAL
jgi:hypothetical protein